MEYMNQNTNLKPENSNTEPNIKPENENTKTKIEEATEYIGIRYLADIMIKQAKIYESNKQIMSMKNNLLSVFEMGHKDGYYYLAMYYKLKGNYHKMKTYFLLNIEKYHCDESMLEMGLHYDDLKIYDKMVSYYFMSSTYNNISAIYNLSQFYKSGDNDKQKMLYYINLGIELGDVDCIYELSIYYGSITEFDKMVEYYELAIEKDDGTCVNDGIMGFNIFYVLKFLEMRPNKSQKVMKKFLELQKKNTDYLTYKNKINLFTKLQHIQECMICYETKLHIDINCGHTFCVDCYCKIYKNPCPLCRY